MKNNMKKVFVASIACLSLGTSIGVHATTIGKEAIAISDNLKEVVEDSIISNGDFNAGLDHWIVSNPESNNPTLVTENGVSYVKAMLGENIHQYVKLQPNTTYTFSYDAAGSKKFPGKVEFGTLNHGEEFVSLQESAHNNEQWERYSFTFTTPEKDNTYIIRFSSTGNGWATFKNIDIQSEDDTSQNTLLSVGVESHQPYIYLNLAPEQFNSKQRLMVYLDGNYYFETYNGKAYYSYKDITDELVKIRRGFEGNKGEKIEVYLAPGSPGQSSAGKVLLETYVVEKKLESAATEYDQIVKDIQVVGNKVVMDIDREIFEQDNRIVLYKNDAYIAETYKGKAYYSSVKKMNETVRVTYSKGVVAGDIISVKLVGNRPGTSTTNSFQQLLATIEVE
ncbi:TPA: carbohydrate binding domain-containing protein [Enterococcus hirae]